MTISIYLKKSDEWLFGHIARDLAEKIGIEVTEYPKGLSYLLSDPRGCVGYKAYIPLDAIEIASDKRLIENRFILFGVNRPKTWLLEESAAVHRLLEQNKDSRFIIKYPTSCGASGHYICKGKFDQKRNWPLPYLVQEFVELETPKVYRVYMVNGEYVGSNVRKFPDGIKNDLVAHAKGARYYYDETVAESGIDEAIKALYATGLSSSFGVVDLIRKNDSWLVLEVGTDGIYNHVDRDFDNASLYNKLHEMISVDMIKKSAQYGDLESAPPRPVISVPGSILEK